MLKKITLISILIGIFILLLISQNTKQQEIEGKINQIQYNQGLTIITLQNNSTEILIFTNKIIGLKKDETILVSGKFQKENNKTQVIADKIIKINY